MRQSINSANVIKPPSYLSSASSRDWDQRASNERISSVSVPLCRCFPHMTENSREREPETFSRGFEIYATLDHLSLTHTHTRARASLALTLSPSRQEDKRPRFIEKASLRELVRYLCFRGAPPLVFRYYFTTERNFVIDRVCTRSPLVRAPFCRMLMFRRDSRTRPMFIG